MIGEGVGWNEVVGSRKANTRLQCGPMGANIPHASESSCLLNHYLSPGPQPQGSTKPFEGLYSETHGNKCVFVVKHLESEHLYACAALEECISRHRITSRQPSVGQKKLNAGSSGGQV